MNKILTECKDCHCNCMSNLQSHSNPDGHQEIKLAELQAEHKYILFNDATQRYDEYTGKISDYIEDLIVKLNSFKMKTLNSLKKEFISLYIDSKHQKHPQINRIIKLGFKYQHMQCSDLYNIIKTISNRSIQDKQLDFQQFYQEFKEGISQELKSMLPSTPFNPNISDQFYTNDPKFNKNSFVNQSMLALLEQIPNSNQPSEKQQYSSDSSDSQDFVKKKEKLSFISKEQVEQTQEKAEMKVQMLGEKFTDKEQFFEIILKVVKQITFSKFTDPNSGKKFPKAKFIAGDETGIIVCYTDFRQFIRRGTYIKLENCQIIKFNSSTQLKAKKISQVSISKGFSVDIKRGPSDLDQKLRYIAQARDRKWPSVFGINDNIKRNKGKICKDINLIACVTQVIEDEYRVVGLCKDGSAIIPFYCRMPPQAIQINKTYQFSKMWGYVEQESKLLCLSNLQVNSPIHPKLQPMMIYDEDPTIKNLNERRVQ